MNPWQTTVINPNLAQGATPGEVPAEQMLPSTQDEIRRRQRLAQALMRQGMETSRIRHPLEALGNVAQTAVGAMWGDSARNADKERTQYAVQQQQAAAAKAEAEKSAQHQALAQALTGMDGPRAERARALLAMPGGAGFGSKIAEGLLSQDPLDRQYKQAQIGKLQRGPAPTAKWRNYQDAQRDPRFAQFLKDSKPQTNINLKGEGKYSEERSKAIAKSVSGLEEKSDAARNLAQGYNQVGSLLGNEYVYTGTLGEPIGWMKKTGATLLGVDVKGVKEAEVAEKVRKGLLGKIREMAGDQRMTDADRKFYMETMPAVTDSAEGVALSVEMMQQLASKTMEREQMASRFLQDAQANGKTAQEGWRNYRQWTLEQPIWDPALMERARQVAEQAKQNPPTVGTPLHRATNPETGETIIWKDGQWQPE